MFCLYLWFRVFFAEELLMLFKTVLKAETWNLLLNWLFYPLTIYWMPFPPQNKEIKKVIVNHNSRFFAHILTLQNFNFTSSNSDFFLWILNLQLTIQKKIWFELHKNMTGNLTFLGLNSFLNFYRITTLAFLLRNLLQFWTFSQKIIFFSHQKIKRFKLTLVWSENIMDVNWNWESTFYKISSFVFYIKEIIHPWNYPMLYSPSSQVYMTFFFQTNTNWY